MKVGKALEHAGGVEHWWKGTLEDHTGEEEEKKSNKIYVRSISSVHHCLWLFARKASRILKILEARFLLKTFFAGLKASD